MFLVKLTAVGFICTIIMWIVLRATFKAQDVFTQMVIKRYNHYPTWYVVLSFITVVIFTILTMLGVLYSAIFLLFFR